MSYKRLGDRIYTPDWCALDMVRHFAPAGRVLEPCRGGGAFTRALPDAEWCEIDDGRDFFAWSDPVDWVITNPPFSQTRDFWRHAAKIAEHIVFLVVIRNFFSSDRFIREIESFGGIAEMRFYGGGARLKFPMGNPVGAVYCRRAYDGPMSWSRYQHAQ